MNIFGLPGICMDVTWYHLKLLIISSSYPLWGVLRHASFNKTWHKEFCCEKDLGLCTGKALIMVWSSVERTMFWALDQVSSKNGKKTPEIFLPLFVKTLNSSFFSICLDVSLNRCYILYVDVILYGNEMFTGKGL